MARPTNDKKASTLILRINDETKAYLEEKAAEKGVNTSEYLRDVIENEKSGENKNVIQNFQEPENNVIQNEMPYLSDIEEMCKLLKIEVGEFFKGIEEGLNEGRITYEGKLEFHSEEDVDLSRFKEACDEKGVSYQKAVDKMTQMVWQG